MSSSSLSGGVPGAGATGALTSTGNIDGEKTWNNLDQNVSEENIPRGRVHDRDAVVLRVQILERNRETNRARVEPGENED